MKSRLEIGLIESDNLIKKGGIMLINNIGKTVAVITALVSALVTFTEITFADFGTESFATSLLMLILASYLMYFSLEDAGETLGEESESYKTARGAYEAARRRVDGEAAYGLRDFCIEYSRAELEYRKENMLLIYGYTNEEYRRYQNGESFGRRSRRVFRKVDTLKAVPLTPKTLLSAERRSTKSELYNPERFKILLMFLKLLPSILCMTVTVSVMLTAKDGMTAATVIEGIIKLSTLPIIGFKGYASGYSFVRNSLTPWTETKTRLLDSFLKEKEESKWQSKEETKV